VAPPPQEQEEEGAEPLVANAADEVSCTNGLPSSLADG
jgi:hypothetical protein